SGTRFVRCRTSSAGVRQHAAIPNAPFASVMAHFAVVLILVQFGFERGSNEFPFDAHEQPELAGNIIGEFHDTNCADHHSATPVRRRWRVLWIPDVGTRWRYWYRRRGCDYSGALVPVRR